MQVEQWSDQRTQPSSASADTANADAPPKLIPVGDHGEGVVQQPEYLAPRASLAPLGSATSSIITADEASAIATGIPGRRQMASWALKYTTDSMGFSLQTLMRHGADCARSVLLVEDFSGYVFGAHCTDSWRVKPRYQGNGECFVFQIRPHAVKYSWFQDPSLTERPNARNDFFMLLGVDSAGFGGAPHFALWLDSDLLYGNSGLCHTFASPQLSGKQDFKVKAVELWQVGT